MNEGYEKKSYEDRPTIDARNYRDRIYRCRP